jgi:hypothetical protein
MSMLRKTQIQPTAKLGFGIPKYSSPNKIENVNRFYGRSSSIPNIDISAI